MKREKRQSALRDVRVRPVAAARCFLGTCADAVPKQMEKRKPIRTNLYAWYSVRDELNILSSQDRVDQEPSCWDLFIQENKSKRSATANWSEKVGEQWHFMVDATSFVCSVDDAIEPCKARINSLRLLHMAGHGRKIGRKEAVSALNDGASCRIMPIIGYPSRAGERRLPAVPTATLYAECGVAILALLSFRLEPSTGPIFQRHLTQEVVNK